MLILNSFYRTKILITKKNVKITQYVCRNSSWPRQQSELSGSDGERHGGGHGVLGQFLAHLELSASARRVQLCIVLTSPPPGPFFIFPPSVSYRQSFFFFTSIRYKPCLPRLAFVLFRLCACANDAVVYRFVPVMVV